MSIAPMIDPADPIPPRRWLSSRKLIALLFLCTLIMAYANGPSEQEVRNHQLRWKTAVDEQPWLWGGIYLGIAIGFIALSLPVASGLMVVCGFLFGHWRGAVIISVGAPLGALLAMLASRYLFRGASRRLAARRPGIQRWVEATDRGIDREGWYYLLLLRLTPVIPFFVINAVMGLTRIRPWTFLWVTFIGMLPTTLVFVHVGATASEIRSPSDLITLDTILALMLIVLLPITLRTLLPQGAFVGVRRSVIRTERESDSNRQ